MDDAIFMTPLPPPQPSFPPVCAVAEPVLDQRAPAEHQRRLDLLTEKLVRLGKNSSAGTANKNARVTALGDQIRELEARVSDLETGAGDPVLAGAASELRRCQEGVAAATVSRRALEVRNRDMVESASAALAATAAATETAHQSLHDELLATMDSQFKAATSVVVAKASEATNEAVEASRAAQEAVAALEGRLSTAEAALHASEARLARLIETGCAGLALRLDEAELARIQAKEQFSQLLSTTKANFETRLAEEREDRAASENAIVRVLEEACERLWQE